MRVLQRWRGVIEDYSAITSAAEDREDLFAAILFTIGTLACGLGIAAIIGGFHA